MKVKFKDGFDLFSVYPFLIFGFLLIKDVESSCSWPTPFASSAWRDSSKGDLIFQISSMSGWWIYTEDTDTTQNEWNCLSNTFDADGRLIMLTSQPFQFFSNTNYYAYLCITLTKITDYSYRYYINHGVISVFHYQRLFIYTVNTLSDVDTICADTNGATGSEYQVWMKIGSESDAKINCPWSILGRFRYVHTTSSNVQSCDITTSEFSTCTSNKELTFNYTACTTKVAYSNSDTVWCVANVVASGHNYVTVYNGNDGDSDIDNTNVYRFTCFALFSDASRASIAPSYCRTDQAPDQIPQTNSNTAIGALLVLSAPLETCPTCPELTDPDRGNVTIATVGTSTIATYRCDSTYTLIGAATRGCQSDDTWSGSAPFCSCATPTVPSNGALTTNTEGTTATYTCDTGYTINGASTRNCDLTATTFEGADPTCALCPTILTESGRSYTLSRTFSDTVTVASFTCTNGYTLSGSASLTCQSDGTWANSLPTCVFCGFLSNPQSGSVAITTDGSVSSAAYSCATGYTRMGAQTRTCQTDGTWGGNAPSCQCNTPASPTNGGVVANSTTATYTCSVNYTLYGDTVRSCAADGSGWSGSDPSCTACPTISLLTGGTVTLSTSGTVTTARYTCDEGYSLDGSSTIVCQSSGSWNTAESRCAECPTLTNPSSGIVTLSSSGTKTSATYVCASGYDLNGNTIRLCDSNGDWSLTEPTCTCQAPPWLNFGVMASDGTTVTYTCDQGFTLNGVSSRTCGTDGSGWSDSDPQCVMCTSLYAPTGGTILFSSDDVNTMATFTCNLGYTLSGATPITCLNDGTWTALQPSCAKCTDLSDPSSGSVSLSTINNITTVATFSCSSGYYLSGSFQLTCQSDATWNTADPSCKCNFPTTPTNGAVSVSDSSTGTVASYTCSKGYTLNGLSTRVCQTDGTGWEGSDSTCVVCAAVSLVTFGSFTLTSNDTHTSVSFQCDVGTSLNGISEASCQIDGTWDNTQPTCVLCTTPAELDSGTVALTTTGRVTTATYTCSSGYELTSSGTLTCQTDGTWDLAVPSCVCVAVSSITNGQITISSDQSISSFTCDSGYVLVGSQIRYCQNDGTGWNGTQPTCESPPTSAPSTEDLDDSDFLSLHIAIVISMSIVVLLLILLFVAAVYKYFSLRKESKISSKPKDEEPSDITPPVVAEVSRPQTSKSIRFAEGTKDDDSVPRSESKASASDILVLNGHAKSTKSKPTDSTDTPPGRLTPLPPTGHQFKSFNKRNSPSKSSPKKKIGSPVKKITTPTRKKVSRPMTPIEQRMAEIGADRVRTPDLLSSAPFGYMKPVFCYEAETPLPDISTRPSTRNTTFLMKKQCAPLTNPGGGSISLLTDGLTTSANYSCSSGYSLSGEGFITCQQDQSWDHDIPICQQCESLNTLSSILVTMTTDGHVTKASFSCVSVYTKTGPDSRTCMSDGTWDSSNPVCDCNDPPVIQNGAVIANGETADYTCSLGFTLLGSQIRTCQKDGSGWSGADPSCVLCPTLNNPTGGERTMSTSGTVTSATYTCDSGYTLSGQSTVACQSSGIWETLPTCVECTSLQAPSSGSFAITTSLFISTVTYTCATGYDMIGDPTRTCSTDGSWTGSAPTCICQSPAQPSNGQVVDDGQLATYTCQTGHSLNGQSVRTCSTDGTGWSGTDPSCVECVELSVIDGGSFTQTTNGLVTSVFYTCDTRYTLSGVKSMSCDSTGVWNDTVPTCVICPTLMDPPSGSVTLTTDGYTSTATFSCATGYYVNGVSSFNCLTSGQWAETSPTCKCNLPEQPADGVVSVTDTSDGQLAYYTCNTGYTLFGLPTRRCLANGTGWGESDPTCTSCTLPTIPTGTSAVLSTNGVVTMVTYTCSQNYSLSGTSVQICQSDGTWSDDVPTCNSCTTIVAPDGGDVSIATDGVATSAVYTCNEGFTLGGKTSLTCQTDGIWNGTAPECVSCPSLTNQASGSASTSTDGYVTMATFTCVPGYYLSGLSSLNCQTTGQWDGDSPTCECNFPQTPTNGDVSIKDSVEGTVAEYACDNNYTLSGASTRLCGSDGTGWTGSEPTCVLCSLAPTPTETTAVLSTNGTVTTVTYTCAQGYTLSGTTVQMCQSDGTWSDTVPTCVSCPSLSEPASGSVSTSTNGYVTKATFNCVSGYYLSGTSSLNCETTGQWDGDSPTCECNFPVSPVNGDLSVKDSMEGTIAEYTCNINYTLSDSSIRVCASDGTGWTGKVPTCVLCSLAPTPTETTAILSTNGTVTTVTYTCAQGYTLSGTPVQMCQSDGTWSDTVPTCALCSAIEAPTGGSVNIETDGLVTIVSYTCSDGYTLKGITNLTCNADGTANSTVPTCVSCPTLNDPTSGAVSTSTDGYVTKAVFTCVSGYYMSGSSSIHCQITGQWDGDSPTCECNFPVSPSNGDVSVKDTVEGSVAEYTCDTNFTLSGSSPRLCQNNGMGWAGAEPTCLLCAQVNLVQPLSATFSSSGTMTSVTYTCAVNYTLTGTSVLTCTSDGTWTNVPPTCAMCQLIETPDGGSISIETDGLVTTASFTCSEGYTLNGNVNLACGADGTLDNTVPTCVSCPPLNNPTSGAVASSTDGYVTSAVFSCVSGYYLSGSSSLSCQTTGLWDGDSPTCECNFPANPANGDVSVKDSTAGSVAEYTCAINYTLSGFSSRICQNNGTGWAGTEPTCVSCSLVSPAFPLSATFASSGTVTSVTYTCAINYTLTGTSVQTCISDGTWTSVPPTCEPCDDISIIASGSVTFTTDGLVTQAIFMCASGYSLNSTGAITCMTNGTWNNVHPICICDPPAAPSNGDVQLSSDRRAANYSCANEYALVGTVQRFCLNDGTGWNGTDPTCELMTASPVASTEDSSSFPMHISLFIILIIVIAILLALVVFCAYRRFKTEKKPSKIGATYDKNTPTEVPEREKSFGSDKISKDLEKGKEFLIAKTSGKKLSFDVRNLTPTLPHEVPNLKFDSERPRQLKVRKNTPTKPPELPRRPTEPSTDLPLSSVRLPKLKSQPPQNHAVPQTKRRRRKKPSQPPAKESLISGSSESSTPIDIQLSRENTPDLLSTVEFDYIHPIYCHEAQSPEATESTISSPSKSRPTTSKGGPSSSKPRPATAKSRPTTSKSLPSYLNEDEDY